MRGMLLAPPPVRGGRGSHVTKKLRSAGMVDIRLAQPRTGQLWFWALAIAGAALLLWASTFLFGDATEPDRVRGVGANAGFGEARAPLIPMPAEPFPEVDPIETRDLGRLVQVNGVVENGPRASSAWIRSSDGRRILLRFEPEPPEGALARFGPGSSINVEGYIEKISRAEFDVWLDTLNASVPRPPPGRKFGDLPPATFAQLDSLYVKTYYISVRPEALEPQESSTAQGAA